MTVATTVVVGVLLMLPGGASAASSRLWVIGATGGVHRLLEYEAGASGPATPIAEISGSDTNLVSPESIAVDPSGNVWVADNSPSPTARVMEYAAGATGNVAPIATLAGAATKITETYGIQFDSRGDLLLGNVGSDGDPDRVLEFARGATGNAAPVLNLAGSKTKLDAPADVTTDTAGHLWVDNYDGDALEEFAAGLRGTVNQAPLLRIAGTATHLATPFGIAVDGSGNVFTANNLESTATEYAAGATGNVAPTATLPAATTDAGGNPTGGTLLSGPTQLKLDSAGTRYIANGSGTATIAEFAAGVSGAHAPTNQIDGSGAGITGTRAVALAPPSAVTMPGGGVGTTATLVGGVNPQGVDVKYHFEWGTTTAYGSATTVADAGSGGSIQTVSAQLSGLTAGTTYHYRIVATGLGGTSDGADQTLTVPASTAYMPGLVIANQATDSVVGFPVGAFGDVAPSFRLTGANTRISGPFGVAIDASGRTWVSSNSSNSLEAFAPGATGNAKPTVVISGTATGLGGPNGIAIGPDGRIWAGNSNGSVTAYAPSATGNAAPVATIEGDQTGLFGAQGVAVSATGLVYVTGSGDDAVRVFSPSANGDVAPLMTITGADTQLSSPESVALNPAGELLVGDANDALQLFAAGVGGDAKPLASITGAKTQLSGVFGAALDVSGHRFAANYGTSTVTEHANGTTGNAAPAVVIGGALTGVSFPGAMALVRPTALTSNTVNSITTSGATLVGYVNPGGLDAHYSFQYGTTALYGKTTTAKDAGAGAAKTVSTAITGLTTATTYHYRLVSTSDAGASYGKDLTFTTK